MRRKRFFVLTENNQLQYFKSEDTRQPIAGNIPLDTLCAIDNYDEENIKETGQSASIGYQMFVYVCMFVCHLGGYTFRLHSQKATYLLTAKTSEEADDWIVSLQYVSSHPLLPSSVLSCDCHMTCSCSSHFLLRPLTAAILFRH